MCVYLLIAFCFIEKPKVRKTLSNGLCLNKWKELEGVCKGVVGKEGTPKISLKVIPFGQSQLEQIFFTGLFLPIHKDGVLLHILMYRVHNIV